MKKVQAKNWFYQFRVQQKIALGYGLALGIAIAGTSAGIILADQQQKQAEAMGRDALEELGLVTSLQVGALQTLAHQERSRALLTDSKSCAESCMKLRKHSNQFRQVWEQFEESEGGTKGQEAIERPGEVEAVDDFLKKYQGVPEAYSQALEQLLRNFNSSNFTPEEAERLRAGLDQLERSELTNQVNNLADDLTTIAALIHQEYEEAQLAISKSHALRLWVIGASMAGSAAIAIVLSILTSRAIARPIQSLTQVTQQALSESNFSLQVPVTTKDEVGVLTVSFNQLIAFVKTLLDQQQEYSETLEKKVDERTQELSDKNIQLQELLEKLHSTQVQMIQSEKMSSLGQLVAGVAHEINNPVNFIHGNLAYVQEYTDNLLGFVQLYQKYYSTPVTEIEKEAKDIDLEFLQEDFPKLLSSMKLGTDRIREIVVSLRNFSRIDEAEFKAVDLHGGIDSTLLILQHRLKATPESPAIRVTRDYGNLPLVECYPGQINQVLMNILANAIDAIEECNAGRTFQDIKDHPGQIEIHTAMLDSQWVQIAITDNGSGMPKATQQQIFNPFFTTKPVGKGTGMGMAISYQIITEKHGGTLECFSTLGEGTKFIIQVPVKQLVPDTV
jgi:signal transduction histidine kinase